MKKGNEKNEKRRQKKALKDAHRRAEVKKKAQQKPGAPKAFLLSGKALDFWRAHGVNYILSDYENATWTPLFDLYGEEKSDPPDLNEVAKVVMDKFGDKSWPPEGRAALGWAVSSPETLTVYYKEAYRRMSEKVFDPEKMMGPDATELILQPHNAVVWGLFSELREQLAKRTAYFQASPKGGLTRDGNVDDFTLGTPPKDPLSSVFKEPKTV